MSRQAPENRRRVVSRWNMLWLSIVFFILLSVVMQKCGIKIMKQTEDSELIQKPHRD